MTCLAAKKRHQPSFRVEKITIVWFILNRYAMAAQEQKERHGKMIHIKTSITKQSKNEKLPHLTDNLNYMSLLQNALFAQTLRYAQNFILGISTICLR
jgi:hypothetical protein